MLLADHPNDGIPNSYPLALNGCGDGVPALYCNDYQFVSGGLGNILPAQPWSNSTMIGAVAGALIGRSIGKNWDYGPSDNSKLAGTLIGLFVGMKIGEQLK